LINEVISLQSFDVASWVGLPASFTLRVLDLLTSTELYNSGAVSLGASSVHLTPDVSSENGLALVWDDPGQGKFGLDNITVTADPIPEPGTTALGLLGLGAIAVARRRKV
jgi:MYXO-CTERM domain-containing protein